jgi:hypothetical protein
VLSRYRLGQWATDRFAAVQHAQHPRLGLWPSFTHADIVT